ncbi:MAG: hypothetical protein HFJ58_00740 [Clostridia bacterium]|nr:hypothetical protein [Clostridia bacterium]
MKQIREMLKNRNFYLYILISIVFFGIFCKMEYATDTYSVLETPFKDMLIHFISSGRLVTAGWYAIYRVFNLSNNMVYMLSFILAIVCTSISIYKLENIFSKDIKSKAISILAAVLIIINIFSIELYLFIEKGILMLSVLFCICAVEKLIKYFEGNKKALVWVFLYMLLANFSYQGTVGIFVSIALLYIVKYTKDIKSFVMNTIVTGLGYAIPALINYITVRFIFVNNRVNGANNFLDAITKIIAGTKSMMFSTFEIMPKYLFIIVIAILSLIIVYNIVTNNIKSKKKIWLILGMLMIIIGNLVVTIFPQIMQNTASIWFVPRSTYTFAALLGILLVYLFMNTEVNIKLEKLLLIALIIYLSIQYVSFQNIARDRYILNYMDNYTIMQIQEKIESYEKETNNRVSKISFYEGNSKKYTYPKLFVNGDTNIKAFYPEWSRLNALNYYLNRKLENVENDEKIEEHYFKDKIWEYYNDEQIIIEGDTVHMFIY